METNVNAYLLSVPEESPNHAAIKAMLDNASASADDMINNYNTLVDTFNSGDKSKYGQANKV